MFFSGGKMTQKTHIYDMRGVLIEFPNDTHIIDTRTDNSFTKYKKAKVKLTEGKISAKEVAEMKVELVTTYNEFVKKGIIVAASIPGIEKLLQTDCAEGNEVAVFTSDSDLLQYALEQSKLEAYVKVRYLCSEVGEKESPESHVKVLDDIIARGMVPKRFIDDESEKLFPHLEAVARVLGEIDYEGILFEQRKAKPQNERYTTESGLVIPYRIIPSFDLV